MDDRWAERDTTPGRVEAALRRMFVERHSQERAYVPARVMNLVVVVDAEFRGEIENRLERVGRFHPSRLILCAVEEGRTKLDAWAAIGVDDAPQSGSIAVGRERVELTVGPRHLPKLDTIVDPLLVTDLTTMAWSPHGHHDAIDALRRLAEIVLIDTQDEPNVDHALARAADLAEHAYIVDLAWLRSTPWRERVAAALLFCGWLSSRLGWKPGSLSHSHERWSGRARARRHEVSVRLDFVDQNAPGLAGVTIETAAGEAVSLDRSEGGLKAVRRARDGSEQAYTVLGASRGEAGILGEGVRQALLRDPTYRPALACARVMVS